MSLLLQTNSDGKLFSESPAEPTPHRPTDTCHKL